MEWWKREDQLQQSQNQNGGLGEDGGASGQYNNYQNGDDSWYWSSTGMAVRYIVIVLLFAAVLLLFLGSYWHAQRRIRRGLAPLPYHAWMIRRRQPRQDPYYYQPDPYRQHQQQYGYYPDGQGPLPPPPYMAPPPAYAPPAGASKAMADQSFPSGQTHRPDDQGPSNQALPPLPTARQR